jgi:Zn-dependent protease
VPYNPYNLQSKYGPALVAAAGPGTNIIISFVFAMVVRASLFVAMPDAVVSLAGQIAFINLFLAIFNLIPIPPLDGAKVAFSWLPYRYAHIEAMLERWGIIGIFLVVFVLWQFIEPVVYWIFSLMTGFTF